MSRILIILIIVILTALTVAAQGSTAYRVRSGSAVPSGSCNHGPPVTDIYYRTTTNIEYYCSATNTWTPYPAAAGGTVTSVSVSTANGVSGSVATATTTPAITLTLGAITPTTVNGNTITTGTGTLTLGSVTLNAGVGGTLGTAAFTAASAYEVPLTFSTGLTRTVNTITVNTSQNIATLSNLTSNGLVKTGGGVGTLSVDTTAYGTGSVTSIATTSPITGGTITTTGTIACATCVTSAAALTANALVLGGGSQATAVLGSLGTTTTVLHGNAAGAPSFGAVVNADVTSIDAATKLTGITPIANGGTALSALGTALQQLRVNAGATALEYFTPASSGLTVGTTAITSGTGTRLLYETSGNVLGEISGATSNGTVLTLVAPVLGVAAATSLAVTGTAGAGFTEHPTQSSPPSTPATGYRDYADSTGRRAWIRASDGFTRTWDATLTANRVYTLPDAATTFPIATQAITFAGPTAARTYTFPDAAATIARIDAGQTFTGVNTMTSPIFNTDITTPIIKPTSDSTTAVKVTKADGTTAVATWDTTNAILKLNSAGNDILQIIGSGNASMRSGLYVQATNTLGAATSYWENNRGGFASYAGFLVGGATNNAGNLFGFSRADKTFIFADGASSLGLVIGTLINQPLVFGQNGVARWQLDTVAGHLVGVTDNVQDIGQSGALRPRTGYFGTSVVAPNVTATAHVGGGSTPSVSSGTIGTGSKNTAGFITSATTGTYTGVLTFSGFTATTGWSCSITNGTTANIMQQSASATTTATFTGTTVTGDVLRYTCFPY